MNHIKCKHDTYLSSKASRSGAAQVGRIKNKMKAKKRQCKEEYKWLCTIGTLPLK
jgi:hypothetical protein